MIKFTKDHEWLKIEHDHIGSVGITPYAKNQLGNLVFIELPSVGKQLTRGGEAAVVESVKAASEIYAPVSGEVVEINEALANDPSLIDSNPSEAWFFKLKVNNPTECDELMSEENYEAYIKGC